MTRSKSGPWIAGTVILSLLLVAASWFLAISPVMASTQEASEQALSQREQNAVLQTKLKRLKEQSLKLDEYKATLAGLQVQIPPESALADYQRQLAAIAATYSVTIVSLSTTNPSQIVPTTVAADVPDPAAAPDTTNAAEGATSADGPAVAPAAPSNVIDGFYELGLAFEVVGTYAGVSAFLNDVQATPGRIFVVTALSGSSTTDTQAAGGRPATAVGTWTCPSPVRCSSSRTPARLRLCRSTRLPHRPRSPCRRATRTRCCRSGSD